MQDRTKDTRLFELDWLRIFAILSVFLFHSLRFFDSEGWHVKNPVLYPAVDPLIRYFVLWIMPIMFVISGASVYFALGKRKTGVFLKARSLRLLVPLVIGIFSHVMWQVYLERVTHGQFRGSFFRFIPHYFDGFYGFGGNFAWMGLHLWYLLLLFLFSLIFLPLLLWLKKGSGGRVITGLARKLAGPIGIYLPAVPIMLLLALPNPDSPLTGRFWGGWSLAAHACFFLNGFLLVSDDSFYGRVRRMRWISLAAGSVLVVGLSIWYSRGGDPVYGTAYYAQILTLYGLTAWCWVLAIVGFGANHFRSNRPYLAHFNEGVLPFYILHQTVLLTVGYFIVGTSLSSFTKWGLIAGISLAVCTGLYEALIWRFSWLRFLFGLRRLPEKATKRGERRGLSSYPQSNPASAQDRRDRLESPRSSP